MEETVKLVLEQDLGPILAAVDDVYLYLWLFCVELI
jgi:hypothetical protein